jgi:hypothetical protein
MRPSARSYLKNVTRLVFVDLESQEVVNCSHSNRIIRFDPNPTARCQTFTISPQQKSRRAVTQLDYRSSPRPLQVGHVIFFVPLQTGQGWCKTMSVVSCPVALQEVHGTVPLPLHAGHSIAFSPPNLQRSIVRRENDRVAAGMSALGLSERTRLRKFIA